MKPRTRAERSHSGRPARPARPQSESAHAPHAPTPPPAPPLWRDPWAWVCVLAVIPVLVHSLGAPLGEPVAEDFDFLHHALFAPFTLLDGGGSHSFWRPLSHQTYYRSLAPLILRHPGVVAALHAALLGLASLLLYRSFRRAWPAGWSATIATFPLLSESTRTLVAWPSHFVDLGVWLFTAVAIHEAAARRLWSVLAALLAALLCKEVALVAVALVPWLPGIGPPGRNARLRWAAATGALALAWAAAYWVIRERAGLHLPHELETSPATVGTPLVSRLAWAVIGSLRAYLSLPFIHVFRQEPIVTAALILVALGAGLALASAARRRELFRARGLMAWGLAWFLAASATMAPIYPYWMPNRSGYASLGMGAFAAALLGPAHPGLLGGLAALRLVAFGLSPGPPQDITTGPPETGAFLDFERLTRLQRLVQETRHTLEAAHPTLPAHARVGLYNLPHGAEYSFGGSRSIQAWYRDTTLHWVKFSDMVNHPDTSYVVVVEFEQRTRPQLTLVPADAMHALAWGLNVSVRREWEAAFAYLALAESLAPDTNAVLFRAQVIGNRAVVLAATGALREADRDARRGLELWPENVYAHYALALVAYRRGMLPEASKEVDIVLQLKPDHSGARRLADLIREARTGAAGAPGTPPR